MNCRYDSSSSCSGSIKNQIRFHCEAVSAADKNSKRFETIQERLEKFKKHNEDGTSQLNYLFEWIHQYNYLEREAESTWKYITKFNRENSSQVSKKLAPTCSRHDNESHTHIEYLESFQSTLNDHRTDDFSSVKSKETSSHGDGGRTELCSFQLSLMEIGSNYTDFVFDMKQILLKAENALSILRCNENQSRHLSSCFVTEGKINDQTTNFIDPPLAQEGKTCLNYSDIAKFLLKCREDLAHHYDVLEEECRKNTNETESAREKILLHFKSCNNDPTNGDFRNEVLPPHVIESINEIRREFSSSDESEDQDDGLNSKRAEINMLMKELAWEFKELQRSCAEATTDSSKELDCRNIEGTSKDNESGHWDDHSRLVFMNIYKYWERCKSAHRKKAAFTRLHKELPHKTTIELEQKWNCIEQQKFKKQRGKSAMEDLKRERNKFVKCALRRIDELRDLFIERSVNDAKNAINQALTSEKNARTKMLRKAREEAAKLLSEERAMRSAQFKEVERKVEAQKQQDKDMTKTILKKYLDVKQKQFQNAEMLMHQQKYQDEVKRLERMLKNEGRVCFRRNEREQKIKHLRDMAVQASRAEIQRLERLNNIAANVPYYSSIINKKSDLHKSTIARTNDVFEPESSGLADFQLGEKRIRSFTTEKLFSDQRFRLGNALHEAGLAKTQYAKEVVKRLIPRKMERTTGIEPF